MNAPELVEALAATRIGGTFNQYSASGLRRARLAAYLEARFDAHSDTTDIKTKRSATERDVSRDGLVLIRLQTERGSLIATVPVLAVSLASPQLME